MLFFALASLGQAPTFAYLETNHFDVTPTGPVRGVGDVDGDGDQDALFGSVLYRNDGKAFFTRDVELQLGSRAAWSTSTAMRAVSWCRSRAARAA